MGFITWLMNFDTSDFDDWVLGGDFNLIRYPENRNKLGGYQREMNLFNEAISYLDLVDIPLVVETTPGAICRMMHCW